MRVPIGWLRSFCNPELTTDEIADQLTLSGLELERIDSLGVADTEGFVVGEVIAVEPHPDADRLSVCRVDTGDGERAIVCGAPNVAAGQIVAVALPGATMPDGSQLKRAKLRGIESHGMILAACEVGLGEEHDGIMVLAGGLAAGTPLADHLPISDEALELEVNPNRPDCMSIYGVARELHAITGAPLTDDPTATDADAGGVGSADELVTIEVDPEICLRFTARAFGGVQVRPSPVWLQQRLLAAGQRPISNVVDITNYVMLETGQPLHAFDLDRVRGGCIDVRRGRAGERMTTLDGVDRELDDQIAVVADAEGASGIAGIMGGQVSEVSAGTSRVLIEAATWVGPNILATSKRLGLRTEASARFERRLHPDSAIAAQRLAARLMVELCGATLVPGTIDIYPSKVEPSRVELRLDRLERLLGVAIGRDEASAILERLGYAVEPKGEGSLSALVPFWRHADTVREIDLIEEVVRVRGLDRLPATLPARREAIGGLTVEQRLRRRTVDALVDRGLSEACSYSFVSRAAIEQLRLDLDGDLLVITNPMTEDQAVMRPTLLPGLLDALSHNASHGRAGLAMFEQAAVYGAGDAEVRGPSSPQGARPASERLHLAALATSAGGRSWRSKPSVADFYSAKGLVEVVTSLHGVEPTFEVGDAPRFLDPSRSAGVVASGMTLGWVGELHPLVVGDWGFEAVAIAGFELDLEAIFELTSREPESYRPVGAFPAVREDIAIVAPVEVTAAMLELAIRAGGGDLLAAVRLFDLYEGDQVGAGNRSLAFSLEFVAHDRTLTADEVGDRRAAIEVEVAGIGGLIRA